MNFKDYTYERPNMESLKTAFLEALDAFKVAKNAQSALSAMTQINQLRFDFQTMATLSSIRHSLDVHDAFYDAEKSFFDQNGPQFSQLNNLYYQALVQSPLRGELEALKGSLLFAKAELSLKTFAPEIMADLQEENRLSSEFNKLMASAQIEFEGEQRNLSQMIPFNQHKDRDMRKRASQATSGWLAQHEATLDDLYDQLIQVRTTMAKKLGFDSFIELAYARWGRSDYGPEEVASFRDQVVETVVPLNTQLAKEKQARLGLESLYHYDLALEFLSGNPTPKGDTAWMVEQASTMYREMSPETNDFFSFMKERNLLDLEAKKGKRGGGYCTFIANYGSPFIFSNFNGTQGDVDVLTHEAGHAFQMYMSRHHDVPEYRTSSLDIMEIHSMSMEFFAWPWMTHFFKEETEKYKYSHLTKALNLLAYASLLDEFQHEVYAKPNLSKEARKERFKALGKRYYPYRQYDDNDYLERGNAWQNVMHLFVVPFYMIDYALAQISALQYWVEDAENHENAWASYLKLCAAGGSMSYLELLNLAGRHNPFEPGSLKRIVPHIEAYLNGVDDTTL